MFNVYSGAGVSFHATIPVMDKDFMQSFLGDENKKLDVSLLADEIIDATGFHVEVGARFKPILIPFAVNVKFRQTFVDGIVPDKSSFSTITLGLGFQI